jgi:hypothetical protein
VDEVTQRIAERLTAPAGESLPPADLAARILDAVRQRRRQRRRRTVLAGVVAVVAAVAIVALRDPGPSATPPGPPATLLPPAPTLVAPPAPEALYQLVDRSSAVTQPVLIESTGYLFRVDSVGPTGALLGGTGFDGDGFRDTDARVWVAAPGDAPPVPLTARVDAWEEAVGDRIAAWLEHRDDQHDYQLICATLDGDRRPVQISDRGVPKGYPDPVHVDRDTIVWMDESEQTWSVNGCTGVPRRLPVSGPVVAFAYPDAFVVDLSTHDVRMVNVETHATSPAPALPRVDWRVATFTGVAASAEAIAWLQGSTLMVFDRATGLTREVTAALPSSNGLNGDVIALTAAGRLVVYATRPMDGSPMSNGALVYDIRTGRSVTLASEAYAAGDLLLWREGTRYVVARIRP